LTSIIILMKSWFDYFRNEAETESINAALDELGEDEYSEEDIRLMRIKFMSEMGN